MNPLAIAAIPSLLQTGYGLYQGIQAQNRLDGLKRPEYEIPKEVNQVLSLAQQEYGSIGRATTEAAAQNQLGAANSVIAARASGNLAQSVTGIEAQRQAGQRQISIAAEQKRAADLARLSMALQAKAVSQETKFQINEFAPYAQAYNEAREQHGAGITNINTGVSGLSSLAQLYMSQQPLSPGELATGVSETVSRNETDGAAIRNVAKTAKQYSGLLPLAQTMFNLQNKPQ